MRIQRRLAWPVLSSQRYAAGGARKRAARIDERHCRARREGLDPFVSIGGQPGYRPTQWRVRPPRHGAREVRAPSWPRQRAVPINPGSIPLSHDPLRFASGPGSRVVIRRDAVRYGARV
ncbi:hypothetical protein Bpla01_33470 [Burkholderia plantarii]|nr:hypothetical protein Bpla01_33470 [Burkholderia plantarii]